MVEVLRSNNPVVISFAKSVLTDAKINHSVADSLMGVIDGSINTVITRIMVDEDSYDEATELLTDAGVSSEDF